MEDDEKELMKAKGRQGSKGTIIALFIILGLAAAAWYWLGYEDDSVLEEMGIENVD